MVMWWCLERGGVQVFCGACFAILLVQRDIPLSDSIGHNGLQELRKQLVLREQELYIAECAGQPSLLLSDAGFFKQLGRHAVFARLEHAVKAAEEKGASRRDTLHHRSSYLVLDKIDFGDIADIEAPKME